MRKGTVAFANFVCTFGDAGAMLDNWDIVGPAFLGDSLVRKHGTSFFHFYETELVELGEENGVPVLAVCGHFVKNLNLTREQAFDAQGTLVKSPASMRSAPSAYFVLILNTHRLIYFSETAHAPDLKSFEATAANFIKKHREAKINRDFRKSEGEFTKKFLRERFPRPTVTVIPLSERERIAEFVDRFETVKSVKLRLIRPNHESDAAEAVNAVRATFGTMNPAHLDILASNSSGLELDEVKKVVVEAAETGNTDIDMRGEDSEGVRLRGTNEEFALTIDLPDAAETDDGLRSQLYDVFKGLVGAGKIRFGEGLDHAVSKIRSLAALL